jgi:hypothetical protein
VKGNALLLFLLLLVVGVILFAIVDSIISANEFHYECVRAGGVPVMTRGSRVCYEPGTVKFAR